MKRKKDVFISVIYADDVSKIFAQLKEKMEFHKAGKGI